MEQEIKEPASARSAGLEPTDSEREKIEEVLSLENLVPKEETAEDPHALYDAYVDALRCSRQEDQGSEGFLRDYLLISHANLDDDSLFERYLTCEYQGAFGAEKEEALERFLGIAACYDWNPNVKGALYLAICNLANNDGYLDKAKDALSALGRCEKTRDKSMRLSLTQAAQAKCFHALIAKQESDGSPAMEEVASARAASALQFMIAGSAKHRELEDALIIFLNGIDIFESTDELVKHVVLGYKSLRDRFEARLKRARKRGVKTDEERETVRTYVRVQVSFATTLAANMDHTHAYQVLQDALDSQMLIAKKDGSFENAGDAKTRHEIQTMQGFSLGILQGAMMAQISQEKPQKTKSGE